LSKLVGVIRNAWLIVGLTLALLAGLEGLYRLQGFVRRSVQPPELVAAESEAAWMTDYRREDKTATEAQQWYPYVYHRAREFSGRFINIDASGTRRTVQQAAAPQAVDVFMFGGSTMFGTFQRDEWTIPSILAKRFEGCGAHVRFTNLGQSGRVFTQEVVDLMLRLRDGSTPSLVVFYDGINDVISHVQHGRPGWPQNEGNRSRDFKLGGAVFWWEATLRSEARAAGYLAMAGLTRLRFLQKVQPFSLPGPLPDMRPSTSDDAQALLTSYAATIRVVEGLGREFGFVPIYVWQPAIHSTRKSLSPVEAQILKGIQEDGFGQRLIEVHRQAAAGIQSVAGQVAGDRFLNLSGVFDQEIGPIFADWLGHTYESANEPLAAALVPSVTRVLAERGVPATCSQR